MASVIPEAGKKTLCQKTGWLLTGRQFIRYQRPVWLHCRIIRRIQYPQQAYCHPQCAAERIEEQTKTTKKSTDKKIGFSASEPRMPGLVAEGSDQWLYQ